MQLEELSGGRRCHAAATVAALSFAAAGLGHGTPRAAARSTAAGTALRLAGSPVRSCASLLLVTFTDGSKVTSAADLAANGGTPAHCEVSVLVPDRINILVELPDRGWNGRYQAVGNGGFAGTLQPPTAGLANGYATSATDTGHQGDFATGEWAWSPTGMNYKQIDDFAYRANHEMALKSKALIEDYYGAALISYPHARAGGDGGRHPGL